MKHLFLFLALAAIAVCIGIVIHSALPASAPAETASAPEETGVSPQPESLAEAAFLPTAGETTVPTEAPDPMQQLLDSMTIDERVGQLFLARCPSENAAGDAITYHLGGYILFGQDFDNQTPESIRQALALYNEAASIPLLIAVDEEGGTVTRVSRVASFRGSRFLSPREYYAQGGLEAVLAAEEEKSSLLQQLGINVNMAPVCDIATSPGSFMYSRSLGQPSQTTSEFVSSTVEIMARYQIGSVLKHFPGYGSNTDTHTGISTDTRPLEELEKEDLIPFQAGIDAGCGAILVSHSIVTAFDGEYPASLSPEVHRYLRQEMGFEGVIITDDLVMGAITELYGAGESAVLAVLAGNDLLCSTDYAVQYAAVLEAVLNGRISMEQLDTAVLRVLRWKQELGLLG